VKVLLDHNLSPRLARALNALFGGDHEVVSLRDKFPPDTPDVKWITELSAEGGWMVISGDRAISRTRAEYEAFRSSKLTGFFLSRGLQKASVQQQMARLLVLWEAMEELANSGKGGWMYELPVKSTKIKKLKD
jgi:hypothetical protein